MRCTLPSGSHGPTTRVRSCKYAAFATGSSADKRDCREELWVHASRWPWHRRQRQCGRLPMYHVLLVWLADAAHSEMKTM